MSEFTEIGLRLNFLDKGGRNAELEDEILYELGAKGSGKWLIIEQGFVSDGLTVPRPLWLILTPWGTMASKAAFVHDKLLKRLQAGNPWPGYETREACDDEFLVAMRALGVDPILAKAVWLSVRAWSLFRRSDSVPALA